ncbi:MAG: response regulator [Polyangiaceae bacterium]|nr:response regulator [Polyangiaceae bacterium]
MSNIRVLVVDDSPTVRRHLVTTLRADPDFVVVGEASDGQSAIRLCERLRPDVVTLDMMIPNGNGVEVTEYIMAYRPTPIVIVSASVNRGELLHTYDALAAGALEIVEKPSGNNLPEGWVNHFKSTVKVASRVKVITHPRARLRKASALLDKPNVDVPSEPVLQAGPISTAGGRYSLVAMGASTGGPAAVAQILSALRPPIPLPILLVMHIGQPFGAALCEWLGTILPLPVSEAKHGDLLPAPGAPRLILAPPDQHLTISGGRMLLDREPERHSCRPSIDVLFESVARELGPRSIGCLLTGMGRDGAAGLLAMKRAGGMTLVQDESTSVVFGMPREAIRLGAAMRILPLGEFPSILTSLAERSAG